MSKLYFTSILIVLLACLMGQASAEGLVNPQLDYQYMIEGRDQLVVVLTKTQRDGDCSPIVMPTIPDYGAYQLLPEYEQLGWRCRAAVWHEIVKQWRTHQFTATDVCMRYKTYCNNDAAAVYLKQGIALYQASPTAVTARTSEPTGGSAVGNTVPQPIANNTPPTVEALPPTNAGKPTAARVTYATQKTVSPETQSVVGPRVNLSVRSPWLIGRVKLPDPPELVRARAELKVLKQQNAQLSAAYTIVEQKAAPLERRVNTLTSQLAQKNRELEARAAQPAMAPVREADAPQADSWPVKHWFLVLVLIAGAFGFGRFDRFLSRQKLAKLEQKSTQLEAENKQLHDTNARLERELGQVTPHIDDAPTWRSRYRVLHQGINDLNKAFRRAWEKHTSAPSLVPLLQLSPEPDENALIVNEMVRQHDECFDVLFGKLKAEHDRDEIRSVALRDQTDARLDDLQAQIDGLKTEQLTAPNSEELSQQILQQEALRDVIGILTDAGVNNLVISRESDERIREIKRLVLRREDGTEVRLIIRSGRN